jgi:hypothetical protein
MTLAEMNLRVFQRRPVPHVFFQPRFEPWYEWNRQFGTLPEEISGLSLRETYDLARSSMRTVHYYTGQSDPIDRVFSPRVKITRVEEGDRMRFTIHTPHGDLMEEQHLTVDRTWRTVTFPVRSVQDLPALRWLLAETEYRFSEESFIRGREFVGDRGEPGFWVPKSPYLAMAQQWMKFEDFIYALADEKEKMEEIFSIIDAAYDRLYVDLTSSKTLRIVNFGENIAMAFLSLPYFDRYLLPWYEKRSGLLRAAGIFTHIHIDGYFRPLLPRLSGMPFDGLEALTPLPQGDVSLEEMRDNIGDKILLDGIPAVLFLEHFPREELYACVEKVISYFHPRLILGISDELPQGSGEEGFKRLLAVSRMCRVGTA